MTIAIADTTVVVHLYRRYAPALAWYGTLVHQLGITTISWLEVMYGAGSKAKQATCKTLLGQFTLIYVADTDQDWAMQQMERYRLSHGLAIDDCLIASVAYRLQVPIYTHNLKDMQPMLGDLAIMPYP